MITLINKFDIFQETPEKHTLNDEYENFVTAHIQAAGKCIQIKPKAKCRVLSKVIAIREKQDNVKKPPLLNKRNPINANVQKFKKT